MNLARRGGADLLLVYRVDRLSRKVRQLAQLAEELDGLDVVLKSAAEPFDTGSAAGRMMLQMLGVFAEFEHAPAKALRILANEAYIGRVHWREETFEGRHEPLIDTDTFTRAGALLEQRGEDCACRVGDAPTSSSPASSTAAAAIAPTSV